MNIKHVMGKMKCYGSTTVGPRGQVVIPASARKEMEIESGDTILVFTGLGGHQGLLLLKADTLEQMLSMLSEGVASLEKMISNKKTKIVITDDEEQ